jgi:hypothetical protein
MFVINESVGGVGGVRFLGCTPGAHKGHFEMAILTLTSIYFIVRRWRLIIGKIIEKN